jgi:hypothetical protein
MALTANCVPRYAKVSSACGCTLTNLSIRGLTPAEIENLQNKEIDLARIVLQATEAKALGVQERGLGMLLRSSIKDIKPQLSTQKVGLQSIVLPYIMRPQEGYINANYFTVQSADAPADAGVSGLHPGAWDLTLFLSNSWLKSDLESLERYFLPGNTLIVLTWDNTTAKNAQTLVFTIARAVNADTDIKKAKVTVYPNINATDWAALSSDAKALLKPTFGVAQTGANSIHDKESWCYEQPADMSKKLLVNWIQTSRTSRCVDEDYMRILDAIMKGKVNEYQRGFVWQSLADQNKRKAMLEEDAWYKSVFFGQAIDTAKQTPNTYDSLPTVADVADPTCPRDYKANALGIFTLLSECNRVIDLNGNALDLDYIFDQLYYLMQHRMASGDSISVIDSMTDRWTADNIFNAMVKYYKAKYQWDTTRFAKIGEKITHDNVVLFNYDIYDIKKIGVQWAVFHDPYFDHLIAAFPDDVAGTDRNFKDRARNLWFIDWSDISIGVAGTMSVTRKQPDPETNALYQCVMVANVKTFNLRSQKWTVMVDRPHRHLIMHNFSDACPKVFPVGCPVPNS